MTFRGKSASFQQVIERDFQIVGGVIKSLVDDRLFGKLVFIRGEMEVGEARLLRVLVGKTDKKVHGHSYVSMREDDDPPPMSFHDLAFSMNK